MAIPDFQSLMLPLMELIADGQSHEVRVATQTIGERLQLTDAEWEEQLPSGRAPLFYNRLAWAKTHLKRAGLLDQPRRGVVMITDRGRQVLAGKPARIDLRLLQTFPEYRQPSVEAGTSPTPAVDAAASAMSPEETLERAYAQIRSELAAELLGSVKQCAPAFFEELVVQLLLNMGYGGSRQEAGKSVGRSGDGGIDGIINEDRLGLDAIYLQAKRWEGVVGRPEIMKFVGALAGQRASKGVFITTSWYTQEAKDYAANSQYKVVLIDGARLAELMIEHDLGVSVAATYQLKRIDSDFFADD
ncbi:MAG: restriction endonuclease [Hydrogenophaga sp.]|nr:restriction endonuclease [Hydrogenophaga sp.]